MSWCVTILKVKLEQQRARERQTNNRREWERNECEKINRDYFQVRVLKRDPTGGEERKKLMAGRKMERLSFL